MAKFLCLVNIYIGHDRVNIFIGHDGEFIFDSKDVCNDRFSFHSKSELMNEQCARRQRSWDQRPEASCTKLTYLGKFQFYLNQLKHRQH